MNKPNGIEPPKWPLKFLRFFVKKEYLEEIEGDMEEVFQDNIEQLSYNQAKRIYTWEMLMLLRPIMMKDPQGGYQLNHYDMFKNYLKTSLRSLKNNSLFSSINIVGLAISMSVGILIIILLSELYSFDNFHAQKDYIYRVTSSKTMHDRKHNLATASVYIGNEIEQQVPGVEKVLILRQGMSADLKTETDIINITGFYTSASFFDVFSFKLKKGNPRTALSGPNAIVLTESASKKIFGYEGPIGKSLNIEDNNGDQNNIINGIVTGVVEDPPINSHIQFEVLVSLKTLDKPLPESGWRGDFKTDPNDLWSSYVYLVLKEHTTKEEVEYAMAKIMADHNAKVQDTIIHLLQPLDSFVTTTSNLLQNLPGPSFEKRKIYAMIGLTLIVLLSACFNYTNLSLARALRRSKEIGIRKVTGASRFQVFTQFMLEAVILALIALVVGLGLFYLIKPEFLNLPNPTARGHQMFLLDINYFQLLYLLLFAIVVGCIAGCLPAVFLSKLKTQVVFNDAGNVKMFSGINLRRLLIVFQFTMSIGLITCTVLVHKQYKFTLNYDLGYTTENIVNINIKGDYIDLLENEYAKMPEVLKTSKSSMVLGVGGATMGFVESEGRGNSIRILVNEIDEKYLDMHEFELLAGSGFMIPLKEGENQKYIVVNEEFLKGLNLGSPEEAIGKIVWHNNNKLSILGVVRDFVNMSLTMNLERSFAFVQTDRTTRYQVLGVKVKSDNLLASMKKLEDIYKEVDPYHPFLATFYDDKIAETYQQYKATYAIISFLAFLAISISTLGLLGMVVFTTESRMKEISIRKVLGARVRNLMLLLSRDFLVMIVLAGLVAIPITLFTVENMILNEFLYKVEMGLIEILSGFTIVMVIGALTIGWQIHAAAVRNPADTLRNE